MMEIGIILLLLEGLLSNQVTYLPNTFPFKLYGVLLYLLILPFLFPQKRKKLWEVAFILGFLYDLFYTSKLFLHPLLFGGTYFIFFFLQAKKCPPAILYFITFLSYLILSYTFSIFIYNTAWTYFGTYLIELLTVNSVVLIPILLLLGFFPQKIISKHFYRYRKIIP